MIWLLKQWWRRKTTEQVTCDLITLVGVLGARPTRPGAVRALRDLGDFCLSFADLVEREP